MVLFETERLYIRTVQPEDEASFIRMASDGSLHDIGFDRDCGTWMKNWTQEARRLAEQNNPRTDWLAYAVVLKSTGEVIGSVGCSYYEDLKEVGIVYFIGAENRGNGYAAEAARAYADYFLRSYDVPKLTATIREANPASWKTAENANFVLTETKLYKDIYDKEAVLYRFYEIKR